jgi:hypothetical protein
MVCGRRGDPQAEVRDLGRAGRPGSAESDFLGADREPRSSRERNGDSQEGRPVSGYGDRPGMLARR